MPTDKEIKAAKAKSDPSLNVFAGFCAGVFIIGGVHGTFSNFLIDAAMVLFGSGLQLFAGTSLTSSNIRKCLEAAEKVREQE